MKTLLIMRHAKSSWKLPETPDHERPLNKRGKQDAPRMGSLLKEQGLVPEIILCSTAKRARQTVKALTEEAGYMREIDYREDFYFTEVEAYLYALRELPDELTIAMVVGHNPDVENLLEMLTREYAPMPTAAIAQVELPIDRWRDLHAIVGGKLVNLWQPRLLG